MKPFSTRMFPSTIVVHVGAYTSGSFGETEPGYSDGGTSMSAYVEQSSSDIVREEIEAGKPMGHKKYSVFTPTDPGAIVDSHIVWNGRTLGALGRSQDLSGAGVLWRTECAEIL